MNLPEPVVKYGKEYTTDTALEWSLNDQNSMQIDLNKSWKQDIFVSQSEVYFESKWTLVEVGIPGNQFAEFSSGIPRFESIESFDKDEKVYSTVIFRVAMKRRIYSMDPYKILTLLGDMGGLLDIIMAFGVLITVNYVKRAFARSLLSDAYQVQSYTENNSEFYPSR